MSSRYTKKRKHDLDDDTSERSRRSDDEASPRKSSRRRKRSDSRSPDRERKGGGNEESISIEETNKLRASLGLPPLELDDKPKVKSPENGEESKNGEKVIVEDGMEFVHKAPESWTQKKINDKLKEKIETSKEKRRIQSKVLKHKGLADSDSDDEGAAAWVEKNRKLEEERKKAEEKARELDLFDEEVEQSVKKVKRVKSSNKSNDTLAGMTVGHARDAFMDGHETILVLDDKNVLDENGEEVLVNPTLQYNEQLKKNLELKKKKGGYNPYDDEDVDEFGVVKKKDILSKYDEGLDGPVVKETFKLNEKGGVDLAQEEEEERVKRNLYMANRQLQSLETPKYKVASEFYTEEEMISFRKPKKKKDGSKSRKRKNKGDIVSELEPEQETEAEKKAREEKLRARRGENGSTSETKSEKMDVEEGEIIETPKPDLPKQRFRDTMGASVDTSKMRSLLEKYKKEQSDEEEDDEDFPDVSNYDGIVIDDDVEDELASLLEKSRKSKLMEQAKREKNDSTARIAEMIKNERGDTDDEMEVEDSDKDKRIVFDSTSEYYKTVGDFQSIGLAGNREGNYTAIIVEEKEYKKKEDNNEDDDEQVTEEISKLKRKHKEKEKKKKHSSSSSKHKKKYRRSRSRSRSKSPVNVKMEVDEDGERPKDSDEYENVLGKEKDVSKGVAGMLKLAAEKGYLEDPNSKKNKGGTLKHLESKCYATVEFGKYDIEDKYLKKMERLGTTGRGPLKHFADKKDYNPQIEITYTDPQGKEMDPKAAFRQLSHKFHGKAPGKKQIEKRMRQQDKKERLKKMNSSDTPLGTLDKQRKKTEQLQTPYLILSGKDRDNLSLQKD